MLKLNFFCAAATLLTLVACQQATNDSQVEQLPTNDTTYTESHRPQFHFSPPRQWMNDPNGMVYYEGEYHLFYQHYPDSNVWGPMHWGHAVSEDLVHWEHLPIALYPDSLGYIFSGSAVVDWNNASGFGVNDEPPLIAIFTYHNDEGAKAERNDYQYQGIAYSNDKGRTWTKYEGNPVVPNPGIRDFRDPKVIWHEDSQQWIMVFAAWDHVKFYGSPNLKDWTPLSEFGKEWGNHGGVWECPDLFPLTIKGAEETKWVLLLSINPGGPNGGSATQCFVGDFDGREFTLDDGFAKAIAEEESAIWLDYGRDNYAGVTWSDIPTEDGRRIFMGWMSNWDYAQIVPTTVWRSAMTIPRELNLLQLKAGLRLSTLPVTELEKLRTKTHALSTIELSDTLELTDSLGFSPAMMEVVLAVELPDDGQVDVGIELGNDQDESYRIGFDQAQNLFYSDRTNAGNTKFSEKFATGLHTAPRVISDNTLELHLFFDVASVELFADNGTTVMTEIFFPNKDFGQVKLYAQKGSVKLKKARFYELKSIW